MKTTMTMLLLAVVGCGTPPPPETSPRILRDRRPEVLSQAIMLKQTRPAEARTPHGMTKPPTTSPTGGVFPGRAVPPLAQPQQPTDPARLAPRPEADWDQPSPTDPASSFDRRFRSRNQYDDLIHLDPRLRDPPSSIWERDFSPERK